MIWIEFYAAGVIALVFGVLGYWIAWSRRMALEARAHRERLHADYSRKVLQDS